MPRRVHLMLFDVDGTLLLSGGAGALALNDAFLALHGVPNAMSRVHPHGKTDPAICQEMFQTHFGREGAEEELARLMEAYLEMLPARVAGSRNYHIMPGFPQVLDALAAREDVLLGLGTGNFERGARIKLERGGLNPYFRFGGFGCDSSDRGRLLEAGFRRGEERARPGTEVVRWVVGDTWRDVRAGRACGARVIAVATGGDTLHGLAEAAPDHLFADFRRGEDLLSVLDGPPA
ncbi:MAG: haloacid dehalogenase-like hydrolase [Candidatus Tectomicrobia bacterium]|uniref:phosphoglycolate phosphatase n=1 Tax=Tectimicrobiota bacterium TaxID=2528274 RepID=A0A932I111_UNCTE|nr:haloacid dehalogenase-like hydrolase [Candidatus Tectomicrobia bacterium]